MIEPRNPEDYGFPDNVMAALGNALGNLQDVDFVLYRSLNTTDANKSIGIDAAEWMPGEVEMGSLRGEPALASYLVTIQYFLKDIDKEAAATLHRNMARKIRTMLYRETALNVALRQLSSVEDGRVERVQAFEVMGQRYASNMIDGAFSALSITEFSITTETSLA